MSPERLTGEQKSGQSSLVKLRELQVEVEIEAAFENLDPDTKFKLNEVAEMLHSQRAPVVHALEDLDMLPETSRIVEWTSTKVQNSSRTFSQDEIRKLNQSDKVRTLTTGQVKEILGLKSQKEVANLAKKNGISPIKPNTKRPEYGTFSLDQVETLRNITGLDGADSTWTEAAEPEQISISEQLSSKARASRIYKVRRGQIPASRILDKLKISRAQLQPALEEYGITPDIVQPEGEQEGKEILSNEEAGMVFRYFISNQARKQAKKPKVA